MGRKSENQNNVRGIRIGGVNWTMAAVTCVVYILLLLLMVKAYRNYEDLERATQRYIVCQQAAEQLRGGSDYLTEQVRMYAETGKLDYVRAYFTEADETRSRERALEQLDQIGVTQGLEETMAKAMELSNELMEIECRSMGLTALAYGADVEKLPEAVRRAALDPENAGLSREELEKKGRALVFDRTYREYKDSIYQHLDGLIQEILLRTQNNVTENSAALSRSLGRQRFIITALFAVNLAMFAFLIGLVIRPLRRCVASIKNGTLFEVAGAYELQYLAQTYNNIYTINAENKEHLRYYAEHDNLTGALNRAAFEGLTRCLAESGTPIALVIVDVDHFKEVNDTYGHETGDAVLKKIAALLHSETRASDSVIRYGGDEFVMILTGAERESAPVICEKIADFNAALGAPEDGLPAVSISAGAAFAEAGYDEEVFRKADQALYRIKNEKRGGCGFAE